MKKQVYTESFCECGFVNHEPHKGAKIKEYNQEKF